MSRLSAAIDWYGRGYVARFMWSLVGVKDTKAARGRSLREALADFGISNPEEWVEKKARLLSSPRMGLFQHAKVRQIQTCGEPATNPRRRLFP